MRPVLSVCMISYNHEHFIEEAIESIITQKTDFPFELIISDDASTDDTNTKILNATKNLPDHITLKYFSQNPNIGMITNFQFALNQCNGTYVAICEGDDYWIDNLKSQKQVNFLEYNAEYNIVSGYAKQYYEKDKIFKAPQEIKSFEFNYKDMIVKNHCTTCATMYRNFIKEGETLKLNPILGGDFQLWMLALGKYGRAMKTKDVFSVYRRHENSVTGIRNKKLNSYVFFKDMVLDKIEKAQIWNKHLDNEADLSVMKLKAIFYKKLAKVAYKHHEISDFFIYYFYYRKFQFLQRLKK